MAVCQLFGHFHAVQHAFAANQLAGLFGGLTGAGSLRGLFKDHLGHGGVFFKELGELFVHHAGHQRADLGVAQLGLGLAFKLCFLQLYADHADQALAHIGAGKAVVFLFQQAMAAAVIVKHTGEGAFKAFLVGAAVGGVYIVGKGKQQLVIT